MGYKISGPLCDRLPFIREAGYTPHHNLVLRELAERANNENGIAWPGVADICRRTWISEGQVRKIIGQLERDGYLQVQRRPNQSSRYRIVLPYVDPVLLNPKKHDHDEDFPPPPPNTPPPSKSTGAHLSEYPSTPWGIPVPYSESTQTGNLTSPSNLSLEKETEPSGAVPVLSLREAGQSIQDSKTKTTATTTATATTTVIEGPPSLAAPYVVTDCVAVFQSLFPDAVVDHEDFEKILSESAITAADFKAMTSWFSTTCNWNLKNEMTSSGLFLQHFQTIYGQWRDYVSKSAVRRPRSKSASPRKYEQSAQEDERLAIYKKLVEKYPCEDI